MKVALWAGGEMRRSDLNDDLTCNVMELCVRKGFVVLRCQ